MGDEGALMRRLALFSLQEMRERERERGGEHINVMPINIQTEKAHKPINTMFPEDQHDRAAVT